MNNREKNEGSTRRKGRRNGSSGRRGRQREEAVYGGGVPQSVQPVEIERLHEARYMLHGGGDSGLIGKTDDLWHDQGSENPEDYNDHHYFEQGEPALRAKPDQIAHIILAGASIGQKKDPAVGPFKRIYCISPAVRSFGFDARQGHRPLAFGHLCLDEVTGLFGCVARVLNTARFKPRTQLRGLLGGGSSACTRSTKALGVFVGAKSLTTAPPISPP